MNIKPLLNLLSISLLAVTIPANAAVIDFEVLEHNHYLDLLNSPYNEDGYVIENLTNATNAFEVLGTDHPNFQDSTRLYNRFVDGVTSLEKQDGTAFNLFSIDLAELNGNVTPPPDLLVTFEGLLSGGGTVTQTFQLDGIAFGAETFLFTGFNNLSSVTWTQAEPSHQFDNIVVSAIPVPAAIWLFGSGLLGLIGFARRKR